MSLGMVRIEQTSTGSMPTIAFSGGQAPKFDEATGRPILGYDPQTGAPILGERSE